MILTVDVRLLSNYHFMIQALSVSTKQEDKSQDHKTQHKSSVLHARDRNCLMFLCFDVHFPMWKTKDYSTIGKIPQVMLAICTRDGMCYQVRLRNLECLTALRDLKPEPCGSVLLACKQAYYKKLKLEPLGVECLQSWNSRATAVSVVGALSALLEDSDAAFTLAVITNALMSENLKSDVAFPR